MSVLNLDFIPLTEDGETKVCNIPISGNYVFFAVGNFGGGIMAIEVSPNNTDWFQVNELSAPGRLIQWLSSGEKLRVSLVGSSSPNIQAGIRQ